MVFRCLDASNYMSLEFIYGTGMCLCKTVGGVTIVLGSVAGTPTASTVLSVTFVGDDIDALAGHRP